VGRNADDRAALTEAFLVWVNGARGNRLKQAGAVLKTGRDVMKTVELSHFGNPEKGETRTRTLRFRTHDVRGNDVDFDDETAIKSSWACQNEEIEQLLTFLTAEFQRTGHYQVFNVDSPVSAILNLLDHSGTTVDALVSALSRHRDIDRIVALLMDSDHGITVAETAVLKHRRDLVGRLRRLVGDPASTETQVQNLIGNEHWIFGGRYVGVADRRSFIALDQTDIPLLSSDGTLHIVELKGPNVGKLVVRHRNHLIVGHAVHEATAQAMNYLRGFDEFGLAVSKSFSNELGQQYDMSRVFATVVVGHSDHHRPPDVAGDAVARTLRQYNAGLNRVEVITYDQLVDAAERALAFEQDSNASRATSK
jgi:hypothetical protein